MAGTTGSVGTGEDARVYDYTGGGNALANTAADSADIGTGTFLLGDVRETITYAKGSKGYELFGGNGEENSISGPKSYLVRRLADGNCWMVQNLDLDLANFTSDKSDRLTSDNTDVSETWIPDKSLNDAGGYRNTFGLSNILEPGPDVTTAEIAAARTTALYQFQSRLYYGRNLVWGSRYLEGGTTAVQSTDTGANQIHSTGVYVQNNANVAYPRSYNNDYGYTTGTLSVEDQEQCTAKAGNNYCRMNGFVGDSTGDNATFPQTGDNLTQDTTWQPELVTHSSADGGDDDQYTMRGTKYIGDYYNWYAATAETGVYDTSGKSVEASGSICPKGWKLPSNTKSAAVGGSWSYLLGSSVYNYSNGNGGSQQPAAVKMMKLPLSIPFTGYYGWANGLLYSRGYGGLFWSSTSTTSSTNAYVLHFDYYGLVSPQDGSNKVYGFTVRCVAHGDELTDSATVIAAQDEDAVTTCSAGKICYDKNGGSGSMADQSASSNSSVTLTASSFTKLGYAFAGWSTTENGFGGSLYGPNETIATGDLSSKGLTLYAKWLPSVGTMQNWTGCSTLAEHQTVALTDNRDGNVYTVAKLKDGNCWMTSNLALNLADFAGTDKLTSENTDIGNNNASNEALSVCDQDEDDCYEENKTVYYWDPETSVRQKFVDAGLTGDYNFPALSTKILGQEQPAQFLSNTETGYYWGTRVSDDGTYTDLGYTINNSNSAIPRTLEIGGVSGYYYNWHGATAESGKLPTATAEDSICPSGWALPSSSTDTTVQSWSNLISVSYEYGSQAQDALKLYEQPFSLIRNGFYDWSTATKRNDKWSATYLTSDGLSGSLQQYLYYLYVTGSTIDNRITDTRKASGLTMRCVRKR